MDSAAPGTLCEQIAATGRRAVAAGTLLGGDRLSPAGDADDGRVEQVHESSDQHDDQSDGARSTRHGAGGLGRMRWRGRGVGHGDR